MIIKMLKISETDSLLDLDSDLDLLMEWILLGEILHSLQSRLQINVEINVAFWIFHLHSSLFPSMFWVIKVEILVKLSSKPPRQHLHLPLVCWPIVTLFMKISNLRNIKILYKSNILPFQETVADNRIDSTMPDRRCKIHDVLVRKVAEAFKYLYEETN